MVHGFLRTVGICAFVGLGLIGCGDSGEAQPAAPAAAAAPAAGGAPAAEAAPAKAAGLFASGKVTMPDGKPISANVKDISVKISGISEAGERVYYTPAVKADGTYKQKLVPGQFRFDRSLITVLSAGNKEFTFPLEPVGSTWSKNQDAADGITQDFLWKPTGLTPYGASQNAPEIGNATHWYGMSIGMAHQGWRSDTNVATKAPPDGTKLEFLCTPKGKGIDGSQPEPKTFERTFKADGYGSYDLNDLLPADYEVTGTATFPDGSKHKILFQGRGSYPKYTPALDAPLEKDNILSGVWKQLAGFVVE